MKYELTKELETGNSIIDREHRELFQAVNQLMDSCGYGKGRAAMEPAIKFLLDYVDKHFAHEEQLQQASGYPGGFQRIRRHYGRTAGGCSRNSGRRALYLGFGEPESVCDNLDYAHQNRR